MITVEHLSKHFGEVVAVRDISFSAASGQVTGFLGPNGAGKTTTLRILCGYMPPTSGQATVAGYDVFEHSMTVRQQVGYLPENVPLYRDMTARNYLQYLAEIRGLPDRRGRASAALARVNLLGRANSRIRTLSKGMRQRLGLAAALLHDPPVLILDEPTIGLDPIQVLELRELVRELGRERTVLFSTHILSEAEQICDQVVIIHQGQIIAQGAPADLRSQLARGGRILVRVAGDEQAALASLRQLPGLLSATAGPEGLILTPQPTAEELRPAIAQALVQGGHAVLEVRPLAVSLEDIFLELTRRQPPAGGQP